MREVCRSEPTFRRRLLVAATFFSGLFAADLFVFGTLARRDLSHRMIDEAFRDSLRTLEEHPPPPILAPDESEPAPAAELCPPGEGLTPARGSPCVAGVPTPAPNPGIFRPVDGRWQRIVTDVRGRVVWRGAGHESARPAGEGGAAAPPGSGAVVENWEIDGRPQDVIALHSGADRSSGRIREVGIPSSDIERELDRLERDLRMKLWIAAGLAGLVLLAAFLYVLKLLHRTRLLEAQAQMDDRLAFVGGLAAGLAHEIRNPLNVLSLNLQMLEEEIAGPAERPGQGGAGLTPEKVEEARVYLTALQGEIRRLSSLVNNFLSFARPSQPKWETRDLNQLLADVCRLVRPDFESRGLTLVQDLSHYVPPVDCDEGQIRQAVMNILINATQILKSGGTVWMRSRLEPAGDVLIQIEDNGPGIRAEDRAKIFEVFYSTRGGGTGLGLPIAARILEAHGGSIVVDSEPGRGARFMLRLPRRRTPAAPPAPRTAAVERP